LASVFKYNFENERQNRKQDLSITRKISK